MSVLKAQNKSQDPSIQLLAKRSTLISGHRGGFDGNLPENSLSRFRMTAKKFKKSAVMLELDVRESTDGQLFILHDATLERTTNGEGQIGQTSSAVLKGLFLKTKDGKLTKEPIPTFAAILDWLSLHQNVFLMVDVKADVLAKVLALIKEKRLIQQCLILTFSPTDTKKVHDLEPNVLVSALISNEKDWEGIQSFHIPHEYLAAYINDKTPPALIEKLQENQILLTSDISEQVKKHPYPFNLPYYRDFLQQMKVSVLITDFPIGVKDLMKR
jgi:glycerophosphoryl diester phosphodiesterase